jgi:hypothetical protein
MLLKFINMTQRRNRNRNTEGGGNPGNLTGEGSGQQTSGLRGHRMNIKRKENYQQSGHKKKTGTHGGNH